MLVVEGERKRERESLWKLSEVIKRQTERLLSESFDAAATTPRVVAANLFFSSFLSLAVLIVLPFRDVTLFTHAASSYDCCRCLCWT